MFNPIPHQIIRHSEMSALPCQKFNNLARANLQTNQSSAMIYLKLINDGCKKKTALQFSKKPVCKIDITKTIDGPSQHRTINFEPNPELSVNGWQLAFPDYDLGKNYEYTPKKFLKVGPEDAVLEKQVKNKFKQNRKMQDLMHRSTQYLKNIENKYQLSGLSKEKLLKKLQEISVEMKQLDLKKYIMQGDCKLYNVGQEIYEQEKIEEETQSIVQQLDAFPIFGHAKEESNLFCYSTFYKVNQQTLWIEQDCDEAAEMNPALMYGIPKEATSNVEGKIKKQFKLKQYTYLEEKPIDYKGISKRIQAQRELIEESKYLLYILKHQNRTHNAYSKRQEKLLVGRQSKEPQQCVDASDNGYGQNLLQSFVTTSKAALQEVFNNQIYLLRNTGISTKEKKKTLSCMLKKAQKTKEEQERVSTAEQPSELINQQFFPTAQQMPNSQQRQRQKNEISIFQRLYENQKPQSQLGSSRKSKFVMNCFNQTITNYSENNNQKKKLPRFEQKLQNYISDVFDKNYALIRQYKRLDTIDDSNIKKMQESYQQKQLKQQQKRNSNESNSSIQGKSMLLNSLKNKQK